MTTMTRPDDLISDLLFSRHRPMDRILMDEPISLSVTISLHLPPTWLWTSFCVQAISSTHIFSGDLIFLRLIYVLRIP